MARYAAIADIGTYFVKLLREKMTPEPVANPEMIGLCSPYDKGDFIVGLWLYDIQELGEYRQVEMVRRSDGQVSHPPLAIELKFMLSVASNADIQARAVDEQRILGRAIQVLYDNAVINPRQVQSSFEDGDPPAALSMEALTIEEKLRFWSDPQKPYRASLFYRVAPILLRSERVRPTSRVTDVDIQLGGS